MSAYRFCIEKTSTKIQNHCWLCNPFRSTGFFALKIGYRVTILYERSSLRLNICSATHFIHVSAYGYVSLTIKEDSLKVWYDYVLWKFWLFVNYSIIYAAHWETEYCKYMSQKTVAFWVMEGKTQKKKTGLNRDFCIPYYFCINPLCFFSLFLNFFLIGPGRTVMYNVNSYTSPYLIETFTVRCLFSLRTDTGKQITTFFDTYNYNSLTYTNCICGTCSGVVQCFH